MHDRPVPSWTAVLVPITYNDWRHRIEDRCRIALTRAFIAQRIDHLDDRGVYSTEQMLRRYGEDHVTKGPSVDRTCSDGNAMLTLSADRR